MIELYEAYKDLHQDELNKSLLQACKHGWLDKVKYLLTSPELSNHADINVKYMNIHSYPFISAAKEGHLDIVKYLINDDSLKDKLDIKTNEGAAFGYACYQGQLHVAQYLLSNSIYRSQINLEANLEKGFSNALVNKQNQILEYLVLELNIAKDGYIDEYLKQYSNDEFSSYIENLFAKREIRQSLEKELGLNKLMDKPIKFKL
jgi:ankyrin repeat protein